MRWALNRLALAITSMVALAFLVPLAVATKEIAHGQGKAVIGVGSAMTAATSPPVTVARVCRRSSTQTLM